MVRTKTETGGISYTHITTVSSNSTTATMAVVVLLLLFLWSPTSADQSQSPLPGFTSRLKPTPAVSITILIATFVLTAFFFLYCRHRPLRRHRTSSSQAPRISFGPCGLDQRFLASFPTLLYSDVRTHKFGKHALECAVCLCEFEDHESLTLLPGCNHAFHPNCIAMWLSSHVTCPVCRRALDVDEEEEEEEKGRDVEVAEVEVEVEEERGPREVGDSKRSRSARAEVAGRWWTEAESERFRLVLPEEVWREVVEGGRRIGRSESARGGDERRSHGGYYVGGRVRRWDWGARSEHWGAVARTVFGWSSRHSGREVDAAVVVSPDGGGGGGGESSGTPSKVLV